MNILYDTDGAHKTCSEDLPNETLTLSSATNSCALFPSLFAKWKHVCVDTKNNNQI